MEYRRNSGKHCSKSYFNYHLFRYWNKFKWLLWRSIGNRIGRLVNYSHSDRIACINMCRWVKYTHGKWCNYLPLEYRRNNGKYHSESKFNYYLFCHWYELRRLLWDCISDRDSGGQWFGCNCNSFSVNCLFWIIKHNYSKWSEQLPLEHRRNNREYHGESNSADHLYCDRR